MIRRWSAPQILTAITGIFNPKPLKYFTLDFYKSYFVLNYSFKNIKNIVEKIVYTIEPSNLLLGLSGFFEQIYVTTTKKMNDSRKIRKLKNV